MTTVNKLQGVRVVIQDPGILGVARQAPKYILTARTCIALYICKVYDKQTNASFGREIGEGGPILQIGKVHQRKV